MFRILLPAALMACATTAAGQACSDRPGHPNFCVRVLACLGEDGTYFDGTARGWNRGDSFGTLSTGETCTGWWSADGPLGFGIAGLACDGGLTADVLYTRQDNATGTVIGTGTDSLGRQITVWSGQNVLEFLTPDGEVSAALPCGDIEVPIS